MQSGFIAKRYKHLVIRKNRSVFSQDLLGFLNFLMVHSQLIKSSRIYLGNFIKLFEIEMTMYILSRPYLKNQC
jgi:hypothetical protein